MTLQVSNPNYFVNRFVTLSNVSSVNNAFTFTTLDLRAVKWRVIPIMLYIVSNTTEFINLLKMYKENKMRLHL